MGYTVRVHLKQSNQNKERKNPERGVGEGKGEEEGEEGGGRR